MPSILLPKTTADSGKELASDTGEKSGSMMHATLSKAFLPKSAGWSMPLIPMLEKLLMLVLKNELGGEMSIEHLRRSSAENASALGLWMAAPWRQRYCQSEDAIDLSKSHEDCKPGDGDLSGAFDEDLWLGNAAGGSQPDDDSLLQELPPTLDRSTSSC